MAYVGTTKLVVIGPYTGRRYHFTKPGMEVLVDYRDAASLKQLKQLVLVAQVG